LKIVWELSCAFSGVIGFRGYSPLLLGLFLSVIFPFSNTTLVVFRLFSESFQNRHFAKGVFLEENKDFWSEFFPQRFEGRGNTDEARPLLC
jgi:hypothetical protein